MVDFKSGKIICDNGLVIDKHLRHADLLAATWEEGQFFTRASYYPDHTHVELRNAMSEDGIQALHFEISTKGIVTGCSIYPSECLPTTFPEHAERLIIRKKMEEWLLHHQKSAAPTKYPWGSVRIVDDALSGRLDIYVAFSSPAIIARRVAHQLQFHFHRLLHKAKFMHKKH